MTELVLLFSVGLAALYFLFAALYGNAYRQRVKLALTPFECLLTRNAILEEAGTGCFGLVVAALALALPLGTPGLRACLYADQRLEKRHESQGRASLAQAAGGRNSYSRRRRNRSRR